MRAIYNGGIKTKILLTLRNYGDSKRASFVNRLAEHHRQSVDRALLWLLQEAQSPSEKGQIPHPH